MSTTITTTSVQGQSDSSSSSNNILHLFPEVDPGLATSTTSTEAAPNDDLNGYDEEQVRLMDEVCIVVDQNDRPVGSASKRVCHLMKNIDRGLLHRAFSVFLFDSQNRLLLQQRASEKITFPDTWTNTCCSHPLGISGEIGSDLDTAVQGVRRAAQRKLNHELGIRPEQVPLDRFRFLTRIHYKAPSDDKWGEHEIDYILFIKADVDVKVNRNEVRDARYVSPRDLQAMFFGHQQTSSPPLKFTPWFRLICDTMLFDWWSQLETASEPSNGESSPGAGVTSLKSDAEIRRML